MPVIHTNQDAAKCPKDPAEHRRRWSLADKLAIVRKSFDPGEAVSTVADRYNVNPNQLSNWRKQYREQILSEMKVDNKAGVAAEQSGVKSDAGGDTGLN
ncbi:transposase [Burkholderia ubonensis]|uniref:transposase n=1 Tax=Burkholderia ubonensis TaxID=101571 RepID=UPI000A63C680|nr:transposase [Burkholderia ubonensis]